MPEQPCTGAPRSAQAVEDLFELLRRRQADLRALLVAVLALQQRRDLAVCFRDVGLDGLFRNTK